VPRLRPSLSWLLIFVPIAVLVRVVPAWHSDVALFMCAGLGIVPLAGLMGRATEELASKLGEGVGGLLNATFGNAAELIIGLMALQKGLTAVVKASITGSIIGNLLLVLGLAMLTGGVQHPVQRFNKMAVRAVSSSLALAAFGLLTPTVFHLAARGTATGWHPVLEQRLSLAIAIVLFTTYVCSMIFALKTHHQLFSSGHSSTHSRVWTRGGALGVLAAATALVALLSEFLVGSVEAARETFGFSEVFVGVIVVAIIGNAAEHSTAVLVAARNKMDLSLGIAIGSSQQVALFVAPVLVFASYAFGSPLTLEFTVPEVVAVIGAVYLVAVISGDGESNWLEGTQLIALYLLLAMLFYYMPA
jgi:Ca2+:H+ antiporter